MLNIQIDDPELEFLVQQNYGENTSSLLEDFSNFIRHRQIQRDVKVGIAALDTGKGIVMSKVMNRIREKYV